MIPMECEALLREIATLRLVMTKEKGKFGGEDGFAAGIALLRLFV